MASSLTENTPARVREADASNAALPCEPQTEFNFNLPSPAELFPTDCQDRRLYERLVTGYGITNAEMRDALRLLSYTRRISDLREKLKPHGYTINKYWLGNGVFIYRLEQIKKEATKGNVILSSENTKKKERTYERRKKRRSKTSDTSRLAEYCD